MAYNAPDSVPRVETKDVVPHYFEGLKKAGDAVAPAVKSYQNKIDLYSVLTLVSGDEAAKKTVSSRFTRAFHTLKSAFEVVVGAMGPPSPVQRLWTEADIYSKCASLGVPEAPRLEKSYRLVLQMPPSDTSFVKFTGDRCGPRMLVTKSFLLSFVTEFVHTADAYRLKADLKNQYLLNDGATAEHVQTMVSRHVAVAGTALQHQVLAGTGVAVDTHASAPLAVAHSLAVLPPRDVAEVSPLASQTQLLAMIPEGETRTAAVMQVLSTMARIEGDAREREERRLDAEHTKKLQSMEFEHKSKMAVIDEERESIRADRKRKDVEFANRCDERNLDLKRRKLSDLDAAIGNALDNETRTQLEAKRAFVAGLSTTTTTLVISATKAEMPTSLRQQVIDSSSGTIDCRLAPGTSLVDLEMEKRTSLRGWVQLVYPSINPTTGELGRLGKLVQDKHASMGRSDARVRTLDGNYAANTYFVRDLLSEPLCSVIDAWAKGLKKARVDAGKTTKLDQAFDSFWRLV